jgi:hypothetical protein
MEEIELELTEEMDEDEEIETSDVLYDDESESEGIVIEVIESSEPI